MFPLMTNLKAKLSTKNKDIYVRSIISLLPGNNSYTARKSVYSISH